MRSERFCKDLDSEGSEAEPTRADLEDIVKDFVVKGQQTDSLMLQNNRLAKEVVEERTYGDGIRGASCWKRSNQKRRKKTYKVKRTTLKT